MEENYLLCYQDRFTKLQKTNITQNKDMFLDPRWKLEPIKNDESMTAKIKDSILAEMPKINCEEKKKAEQKEKKRILTKDVTQKVRSNIY